MATVQSDEDKLIINEEIFYSIRSHIRQNKSRAEIIAKIEELIMPGAHTSACDASYNDSTILHIAIKKKEKDVIIYLLKNCSHLFSKEDRSRGWKIALQKESITLKETPEIKVKQDTTATSSKSKKSQIKQKINEESSQSKGTENERSNLLYTYQKREGTTGVSGQFYETKMLSLVLHRALHDKDIENFYLATNVNNIGNFDDICFRYDNVACFIQCKHKQNVNKGKLTVTRIRNNEEDFGLGEYFDSFLKIRKKFSSSSNDPLFNGAFNEINTYFVLYTPCKGDFDQKFKGNKQICKKLHDIISTSEAKESIFQFVFEDQDLDILTDFVKCRDIEMLGKTFLKFILSNNVKEMMNSELVKMYHPALARRVIVISKETPISLNSQNNSKEQKPPHALDNSYILVGKFRDEFFDSQDKYLMKLKDIFCTEIIFTHSSNTKYTKDEVRDKIQDIVNETSAKTIAELIGSPIEFDNKNCLLILNIKKLPKNMFKRNEIEEIVYCLKTIQVTKTMIKDAVYLAGRKKLQALTFQLPQFFGNIDINASKGLERLNFLAGRFEGLIKYYDQRNRNEYITIIDINKDVVGNIIEVSQLGSNGIGGAVGNLLHFDKPSETFVFNTKDELPENAKYVRDKIKELVGEDLNKYKFKVSIDGFPKLSLDIYQYDKDIAHEFMSKLWFYTNQAQEELVETIIKREISIQYNSDMLSNRFLFHVQTDAIFLRFHDKVQKWWKSSTKKFYLTKTTNFYEEAKQDIVDRPILTVLALMFMRNIKALNIDFDLNTTDDLNLHEFKTKNKHQVLNIVSNAVILSAAKILQYYIYQKNCSFINLDYIYVLPQNDYKIMIKELELLKDATVVIVSETPIKEEQVKTFQELLNAVAKRHVSMECHIIIITDEMLNKNFKDYDFLTIKDENINIRHLTSQSQMFILDKYKVFYQGQKVTLNRIITDDTSKDCINAKILSSLLRKEKIEIGFEIESHNYEQIKNHYISRLHRNGEDYLINTLTDIDDETVLISSKPGMGKTTLLTHLSLQTKLINIKLWVAKIDMASCVKDLERIKNNSVQNLFCFLAKLSLKKPDEMEKVTFIEINKETIIISSEDLENISLELQLFMHFYNTGNIIFLFDSFDKIYSRYKDEAFLLFTTLKQANKRMWIVSDSCCITELTEKFGSPYELKPFTQTQKTGLLDRFWNINVRLDKLNHEQYNNIRIYLNYILSFLNLQFVIEDDRDRYKLAFLSDFFHFLYLVLLDYFKDDAHSLSWIYIREKIKKHLNIDSYTVIDRYLQNVNENDSSQLSGKPFLSYVAKYYFTLDIGDKFNVRLNNQMMLDRSDAYMNILTLYKQFLVINMKKIYDTKTVMISEYSQLRDNFFNNHKKLVLYAVYKKKDLSTIFTPTEINEIEQTINMIKCGETETDSIDTIVETEPTVNLILAEYFLVETLSDLLPHVKKGNFNDLKLDSIWDLFVNVLLYISPPAVRNSFKGRLKYDPSPPGTSTYAKSNKIVFDLILKESVEACSSNYDPDDAVNNALNEGLANIIDFFLNKVRQDLSEDNNNFLMTIIQKGFAFAFESIEDLDGENIVDLLNVFQVSHNITDNIKDLIVEPIKMISKKILELSGNHKNIVILVEELPRHLPQLIRSVYKSINSMDIS